jgi:transcriptional regulator with XRE-family HTH domain
MLEDTRYRLKSYIEEKGYSVASLEKAIGAGNGAVSLFISGKNKGLGNNLEKILIYFKDLSSRWLLTGEGPKEIDYEGVRIEPEKGGQDWGQDRPNIKNEMHIKWQDEEKGFKLSEKEVQAIGEAGYLKHVQNMEKAREEYEKMMNEPYRAFYGDLRDALDRVSTQYSEILRIMMNRLEALEQRLPNPDDAELPGTEK